MASFKLILGILFGFLVAGILILGLLSYQNRRASIETADWVAHSLQVLNYTHEVTRLYKDAQLENSTFLVSPDTMPITAYLDAREPIMPLIQKLKILTEDNSQQGQRIDSLDTLLSALISFNDSVQYLSAVQRTDSLIQARMKKNREFRIRIQEITNAMNDEENRLLEVRQLAHARNERAFNRAYYSLLLLIAILLATTFFAIRYNFNKRIKVQNELRKANDLFARLFYDSPIGIMISQLNDGTIIDCNHAYSVLVNYDKNQLIGRSAVSLGIIQGKKERKEILDRVKQVQGPVKGIEVQLRPKDKSPVWVYISMQFIQIENKECILSAVQDITTHKEAEKKIQESLHAQVELNKLKSNFVTLASHEFRTPLTTILSSAFLLETYSTGENTGKIQKHLARIKGAITSLTSILDEFLSLTKIEEGKIEAKPEVINLKELLEGLCQNYKPIAKPGQTIVYQHEGDTTVCSDPVLLSNILTNLVSNAIKYSGENTPIHIASHVNDSIQLSVKDHGIGISKADQARLFERFFRASNSGNIQGTGLGLHIMKHYVDMLHGQVKVNSAPGEGTEVIVTLANHSDAT